jgi:DNA helicase-2/ATP-dependent DNA helicase PcrA
MDKLIIASNHYNQSIYQIIGQLDQLPIKINAGTKNKLSNFVDTIESLRIMTHNENAFEVTNQVVKRVGLIKDLEAEGTPEAVSRVENVQELLNGIKDFITEKEEKDEAADLALFLEDVALATDFDKDKEDDQPKVSLMTIHLAKGLEYPYVFVVGLEESLFPSAMSMNTRSELEEERRLFYVALTRAEKQAYLSYAQTRYRWGKLIDCEPSRFLEEVDDQYLEQLSPQLRTRPNPNDLDVSLFDDLPKNKIRFQKPIRRTASRANSASNDLEAKRNLKKIPSEEINRTNLFDNKIGVGNTVEHSRFGKGEVKALEGTGANIKATIAFGSAGTKKLLLQFAKLKVIG